MVAEDARPKPPRAASVLPFGWIVVGGTPVEDSSVGVRLALWLRLGLGE